MTNNKNALPLFRWISERCEAAVFSDRLTVDVLGRLKPRLVISYNYMYLIPTECISYMNGNIVNLHIALLPWNRGFSPNIWSFINGTPKGVTIHKVSTRLDEGDILYQKKVWFEPSDETFETTYKKLNEVIVELFQKNWDDIYSGEWRNHIYRQQGEGTYHSISDLKELRRKLDFNWTDNIAAFLERYNVLKTGED